MGVECWLVVGVCIARWCRYRASYEGSGLGREDQITSFVIGVLVAAAAILAGGAAFAAIPDSSGVIHACYAGNGSVRIIDNTTDTCKHNEQALTWKSDGASRAARPTRN